MMAEVGRRRYQKSAKRRSDAINFLANISLDGNFSQPEDSPVKAESRHESRGGKGTGKTATDKQEKQTSDSNLYVPKGRAGLRDVGLTETDASTSEVALIPGTEESLFLGEARGRTRSTTKTILGVSSGSVRVKSFSERHERGSPLIPSKFDPGSRPRAQTQIPSAVDQVIKGRPLHPGLAVDTTVVEGAVPHKPVPYYHNVHHHHHHRHHTTSQVLSSQTQSADTDVLPLVSALKERPACTGVVHVAQSLPLHSHKQSRVLLVSARKVPFSLYSVLPYSRHSQHGLLRNDSDIIATSRTRKSSGTRGMGSDTFSGLTGIELGDSGKEISYRHLLVPTKDQAVYRRQHSMDILSSPHSPALRKIQGHPLSVQWDRGDSEISLLEHAASILPYDPMELDDPGLHAGKHSKVLTFTSYMVSILDYTKPSELKKDINQKFKDKFPHIDLSLSKLRSIKREMKKIAIDAGTLELLTLAHAYVYYEKLVLNGKINKENRKLCAAACLTLAAKMSDTKGADLQNLIKEIEDTFRENRKDFLQLEFPILVALEFSLHLPEAVVLPHYRRIAQLT
ncbi:CDK5 and ABL1 enzyme substrate 2-like isoform X1 [Acanthaster planci]|uniref:CDK5 and ABL1 enzyme substrate 2-like isoform X1 n=1 Tax=Acanthaster planci TaxID=133434 RepID=A0A8B7YUU7_ACAPL|nr:CDK5 and ABL1 enzyme substrate 2-like isoform X1 [Acanthaster planci]